MALSELVFQICSSCKISFTMKKSICFYYKKESKPNFSLQYCKIWVPWQKNIEHNFTIAISDVGFPMFAWATWNRPHFQKVVRIYLKKVSQGRCPKAKKPQSLATLKKKSSPRLETYILHYKTHFNNNTTSKQKLTVEAQRDPHTPQCCQALTRYNKAETKLYTKAFKTGLQEFNNSQECLVVIAKTYVCFNA